MKTMTTMAGIDQFTWPCDFDSDGIQDYFDLDDDGDSVPDLWDAHPWNSEITSNITENNLWNDWVCLLYTSPSPRDMRRSRMPSSA